MGDPLDEQQESSRRSGEATRPFPMQKGPPIPWETAEVIYKAYSRLFGTSQSLQRLGERGGFSWAEVEHIFQELYRRDRELWGELMKQPRI